MNAIAQLTASNELCDELVRLGIEPRAFFWHLKEDNVWDVWEFEEPPKYQKNKKVPAWTTEELNVMLGGDVGVPILLPELETKVITKRVNDKNVTAYEHQYVFWDVKAMFTWLPSPRVINAGATASATILKRALAEKWITAESANDRYSQFFNPPVYEKKPKTEV